MSGSIRASCVVVVRDVKVDSDVVKSRVIGSRPSRLHFDQGMHACTSLGACFLAGWLAGWLVGWLADWYTG